MAQQRRLYRPKKAPKCAQKNPRKTIKFYASFFVASKRPNISPKPTQNSTSTEPCFRWGWNFRPESRQQSPKWPNIAFYVEPMFGKKNGLFYALNQRPKEPHCFWVMSGPDMKELHGVAPFMWAFAAWFWRKNGSWAIYVPKKQLDSMLGKKYGEKSAQKIAKNMSFLGT